MSYSFQENPEIQNPASNTFIVLTLVVALFLNGLPWQGIWLVVRPDFVALVLLYWCTHKPLSVGIGLAWMMGILADVADSSLFGQHALAYSLLAFGGVVLYRRLQMFGLRAQTSQVFGILVLTYAVYTLVHWQVNGYVAWVYFIGCVTSTLLWGPLSIMFRAVQQARMLRERS
ncbi:MAG TPA: rod shape-determining protein MreD [Gallionella sp.]|nr:rod shape-determining protein MreD [Gallionella sp.]